MLYCKNKVSDQFNKQSITTLNSKLSIKKFVRSNPKQCFTKLGHEEIWAIQSVRNHCGQRFLPKISRETKAIIAPVGETRANVLRKNLQIDLFDSDGSHPSYSGTFLAACVFYSVFYGKSQVGLSVPSYISPTSYGTILQRAAWDTVKEL